MTRLEITVTDLSFFAMIIAIVFSLYALGVPIAWQVLKEQGRAGKESTIPPLNPA